MFLLWEPAEYLLIEKNNRTWGESTMQVTTCTLHVQRVAWVLSLATGPSCQFVELKRLSWQESELFGNFHGTLLAHNSVGYNSVLVLEALFGDLGLIAPIIWRLHQAHFNRSFHCTRFQYHSSDIPQFQLSLSIFPHPPYLILPFQYSFPSVHP